MEEEKIGQSSFLLGYANEVANVVKIIAEKHDISLENAIKVADIAARQLISDAIAEVSDSIYDLSETVACASEAYCDVADLACNDDFYDYDEDTEEN